MSYLIEIAVNDFPSATAAAKGGADRIELCSALSEGGLTTSYAVIEACKKKLNIPIFPIIRPRSGDFLYTDEEFQLMQKDALVCKNLGCEGIVTGFLLKDGNIDKERLSVITKIAYPLEVTFHRAFDRCVDPFGALENIIESGCKRILTSGQELTAPQGITLIKQLIEAAKGRIIIMPGSGVRKENIKDLAEKTGAIEFHSSLKNLSKSKMEFIHPAFATSEGEYVNTSADADEVRALREALIVENLNAFPFKYV